MTFETILRKVHDRFFSPEGVKQLTDTSIEPSLDD